VGRCQGVSWTTRRQWHAPSPVLLGGCRTPLNGIVGSAELLSRTPLTSEQADHVACIRECARILLACVNDLLDFNRMAANKLKLHAEAMSPADVARKAMAAVQAAVTENGLVLSADLDAINDVVVVGDPERLQQVSTTRALVMHGACLSFDGADVIACCVLQIFLNLLSNAVRFTPAGGSVTLKGETVNRKPDDTSVILHFEVADTGVGIDEDTQARLWTPFTQADVSTTRKYGGTGLGLSIVKQIVTLMGGTVGVQSAPGKGSTFWFTVTLPVSSRANHATPVASPAALRDAGPAVGLADVDSSCGICGRSLDPSAYGRSDASAPAPSAAAAAVSAGTSLPCAKSDVASCTASVVCGGAASVRGSDAASSAQMPWQPDASRAAVSPPMVLYAEDNAVNVLVMKRMLAKLGYSRLEIASNGKEAVDAVASHDIDIVLMDCHMDVMDGYQACRAIRSMGGAKAAVPVIAVTAAALEDDRRACMTAGMDDVLTKPFSLAELDTVIRRHWNGGAGMTAAAVPQPAAAGGGS